MTDEDDPENRTVIKSPARVVAPAPDSDATIIRPSGAAAAAPWPSAAAAPPTATPDMGNNLPVGTYLGEFELTSLIGEGGFGIVYAATDHSLQRRVALKEYMPSALAARTGGTQVQVKSARHKDTFEAGLKSFVNEARLLAQFDHPSLVKVYRFWEANGTAYMVMPLVEGTTLKDVLRAMGQPPDEAWLIELLEPLTAALQVIHNEQCYHRDIAPDNVMMLAGSNRPLLLDFGAARRVIGDMTQALTVILKPGYAPVEQYAEVPGMKQGPWTDVYALAAVVYFAITGKTPPTSVGRLMNDSYVPLAQAAAGRYSAAFLEAIDRALAVKPEERTQSIGELREALGFTAHAADAQRTVQRPLPSSGAAARSTSGGAAARATQTAAPEGGRSKAPLIAAAGVLGLVLLGGGLYAMLSPSKKAEPAPAVAAAAPAVAPAPPIAEPAAPPSAAPSGPFDPSREFERIAASQSPDYQVVAAADKPRLRIGKDALTLSVKTEREGYLYVLLSGTDGGIVQLFPNGKSKNNRIRAASTLRIPPAGDNWGTDAALGPPGVDHLIAIVSANPRDFSAMGMAVQDGFAMTTRNALDVLVRAQPPGAAPLMLGKPICSPPCADNYGVAVFSVEEYE
jgi:serine/threonine protein kinase